MGHASNRVTTRLGLAQKSCPAHKGDGLGHSNSAHCESIEKSGNTHAQSVSLFANHIGGALFA